MTAPLLSWRQQAAGRTWIKAQYSLSSAQVQALENGTIDCLERSGITVGEWPGGDVLDPAVEARCYDEVIPGIRQE
jgi:hypothetical protein